MRGIRLPKERIIIPERVAARAATRFLVDENGCHISGFRSRVRGYAYVRWVGDDGKVHATTVHRAAWAHQHGQIPDGMIVDHLCHNTLCVRTGHLRLATPTQSRENLSGPHSNSRSGIRGVYWDSRKKLWVAEVRASGRKHRKRFARLADAERWAKEQRAIYHDPIPAMK